ncbi:hypothetical protein BS47DRAFT_1393481 [Hydnum rufescens UP504]|uniref:Uncharacterized protein n=1 Tax=Hydnum rufescens UP504 TaxID=1448309 RepID=A0A9P6DWX5_9AGAM|nr:hypothetical protein BS47DRAFT_1393481 [Hydnum rufescens UP504]
MSEVCDNSYYSCDDLRLPVMQVSGKTLVRKKKDRGNTETSLNKKRSSANPEQLLGALTDGVAPVASVILTARKITINISSSLPDSRFVCDPWNVQLSDVLPEYATEGSVLYHTQMHTPLCALPGRRTVELVSLSIDVPPIRFAFSFLLIPPSAAISFGDSSFPRL